jgi:DNA mismatch repair ATPase MutS
LLQTHAPLTRQATICTELIKRLLQHGPALSAAAAAVGELDCLCSFAAAARELGFCRPRLVRESVIAIEGGACVCERQG